MAYVMTWYDNTLPVVMPTVLVRRLPDFGPPPTLYAADVIVHTNDHRKSVHAQPAAPELSKVVRREVGAFDGDDQVIFWLINPSPVCHPGYRACMLGGLDKDRFQAQLAKDLDVLNEHP